MKAKTEYFEVDSGGRILRGMKHVSKKENDISFLIVHGYFSSNKIGPHRLYVKIADYLSQNYGDCYRFDLSGMGESDGDIEKTTFETHVEDISSVLEYLKASGVKQLIIISHCMGCNLVLETLHTKKYVYREIIFLSPFFCDDAVLNKFFPQEGQLEELKSKGYTYRRGLFVDTSFFTHKTQLEYFIHSINTSGSFVNIIAAKNDQFIPFECNEKLRERGKRLNFLYMDDCDHNFLTKQPQLLEQLKEIIEDERYTDVKA